MVIGGVIGILFQPFLGPRHRQVRGTGSFDGEALIFRGGVPGVWFFRQHCSRRIPPLSLPVCVTSLDQVLMSVGMARSTYIKKIALQPSDIQPALSASLTIDHFFSISIALLGGVIWSAFGYQYVFLAGTVIAALNFFFAARIRIPAKLVYSSPAILDHEHFEIIHFSIILKHNMTLPTPEEQPNKKKQRSSRMLVTTLLFMLAIGLIVAFDFEKIKLFISHAGVWGVVISVIVYGLLGFTVIPSEPLTLLIGAMFGPWVATIASLIGNTLSSLAEYYTGRAIGSATNFMEKKEKLPFGLGKVESGFSQVPDPRARHSRVWGQSSEHHFGCVSRAALALPVDRVCDIDRRFRSVCFWRIWT